jgi:hypothetical protein
MPEYLRFCYGFTHKIRIVENEGLLVGCSKVKHGRVILCLLLVAGTIFSAVSAAGAAAVDMAWNQTTRADFEAGTLSQLNVSSSPGDIKLGVAGVNYLYAFRGNNQKTFWRFNIVTNTWTSMADAPDNVRWGDALAYDGGNYIYAFHGNNSNDFWRYSISGNSWSVMAGAPGSVSEGGAITFNHGYIYALRGNNTRDFWRYNPAINTWTARASTDNNVLLGGALTSDGGSYIYAFQGGDTAAFRRYDTDTDTWTALADAPGAEGTCAALTYDDSRYIYAFCGDTEYSFCRYDILNDTWIKTFAPASIDYGGSIAFDGGSFIYALRGAYSQNFGRYGILTGNWEWRDGTPASVYSSAMVRGAAIYYTAGNIASITRDTGYNADFGVISWTADVPPGTTVKFQIAANSDNSTWVFKGPDGTDASYYTSSGAAVWSGYDGDRYLRYKAFFSTSNTGITPVLHDVTITYTRQILTPNASSGDAAPIDEMTAVLHGSVINDGGETCQYRFQYGNSTGNYTRDTGWIGSITTGDSFSAGISGLSKGTKYYFRAQVKNSAGTGTGPEIALLTRPAPPVAGSFSSKAVSPTQINLTWVKGEGARRTMVRRKTGDYPSDINDGAQIYFDTGASVSDSGLTPGTTYYYSAWSEVTGSQQWSNGSRTASATTMAGGPVVVGGTVYPVNKAMVLAPWLGMAVILLAGSGVSVSLLKRIKT